MKSGLGIGLLVLGISAQAVTAVIHHYRRGHPAQTNPNDTAAPAAVMPKAPGTLFPDQPQKFKDLPANTVFYFWSDRENKSFPKIKNSLTTARPATPGNGVAGASSQVPADSLVIVKKEATKPAGQKK